MSRTGRGGADFQEGPGPETLRAEAAVLRECMERPPAPVSSPWSAGPSGRCPLPPALSGLLFEPQPQPLRKPLRTRGPRVGSPVRGSLRLVAEPLCGLPSSPACWGCWGQCPLRRERSRLDTHAPCLTRPRDRAVGAPAVSRPPLRKTDVERPWCWGRHGLWGQIHCFLILGPLSSGLGALEKSHKLSEPSVLCSRDGRTSVPTPTLKTKTRTPRWSKGRQRTGGARGAGPLRPAHVPRPLSPSHAPPPPALLPLPLRASLGPRLLHLSSVLHGKRLWT